MTSLRLKSTRYAHVGKDWTYITDRVLVIPFPSTEREVREIASMLDTEHPGHYMIFNLSGKKYSSNKFNGPIIEYALQRGEPPTVKQLYDFVDQVYKWLDKNPLNMIVVHCKGKRKDRSAVMVSAWLVSSGYCTSTSEAMQVVGKTLVPLDYPSQIRYLKYYGKSLKSGLPDKDRFIFLHKIRFNTIPNFKFTGGCDPYFSIYQQGKRIFFSKKLKGAKGKTVVDFGCRDISIGGDIKIDFFSNNARKMMFSLTFNTSFEEMTGHRMILYKRDLEGACDDNDNKKFFANFKLELFFITQEKMREVRKKQRELGEFGDDLPLMDDGVNDDEISYSESGKEKKEKVRAEVGRAICSACRNHIFDEESSISLGPRELVHWACLRCGKCSQLLASLGGSGQCVVQGGRVVCDACQEGFWPKCQECHLPVTQQNVVTFGDLVWHPQCAGCQSCKTLQTDTTRPEFHVKKKKIFCHHCAVMSPLADDRIEDYTLTPRQEELLFTIQDGTAARHFDDYLRRTRADENVEFWRDVERYKVLPSAELRTRKAEEIANKYLSPKCIKPINVDASARDKVLAQISSGDHDLFDETQRAVFTMLEHDAYNKYVSSPEYQRYLEALREEPDPDGEAEMHIIEVVEAQLNKDEPFWGADSESERSIETPRATPRETVREIPRDTPREAPKPVPVEPKPVPQVKVEPESPKAVVEPPKPVVEPPKPEPVRPVTPPRPKEDLVPVLEDLSKFSINLGPKCGICSVSIGDDKHLEYKGVTYHWECFRCVHCNKQLGTETFFEKEPSKFYCLEDYNSMFAPKCGTCARQLTGRHLTFLGKKYHLECLGCSNCKINLSNQKFFSIDGAPYCQNCVNSMSM